MPLPAEALASGGAHSIALQGIVTSRRETNVVQNHS